MRDTSQTGRTLRARPAGQGAESHGARVRVLLVGNLVPDDLASAPALTTSIATPDGLDAACLARANPELVLSPLVGAGFDCFDIAERLTAAGYTGRYLAVVESLPNPDLVRRDVRAHFPGLRFDVIVLNRG